MRFTFSAVAACVVLTVKSSAFVPTSSQRPGLLSSRINAVDVVDAPPERVVPGAGKTPAWENRPGLTPEEFLASDMSKPDAGDMWECPLTRWNSDG